MFSLSFESNSHCQRQIKMYILNLNYVRDMLGSGVMSQLCRLAVTVVSYTAAELICKDYSDIADNGKNDDCR